MNFVNAFEQLKKGNFIYESAFAYKGYYFLKNNQIYITAEDGPKSILDLNDTDIINFLFQLKQLLNPERNYEVVLGETILFVPPYDVIKDFDDKKTKEYYDHYTNIILNNVFRCECIYYDNNNLNELEEVIKKMKTCTAIYFTKDWNKSSNTVLLNLIAENYGIERIFEG